MNAPRQASTIADVRQILAEWRRSGASIGLVPTMGALHAGHLSLVRAVQNRTARTIVSIFVNPLQFAPGEDFSAYPRPLEADLERLFEAGVDLAFRPDPAETFAPGFATTVVVAGPARAGLEDAFRPTHFDGVATIVAKLLLICRPDAAAFGEKDFQQLAVVRRLVRDLNIDVDILPGPIVREPDGLAMSSRNVYLSAEERRRAPRLFAALSQAAGALAHGAPVAATLREAGLALQTAGFALDYLELRDSDTLQSMDTLDRNGRLLVAARIGRTRLIDNVAVAPAMDAGSP